MPIILAGGCRVSTMREGPAIKNGTLSIWPRIGPATGAQAISLRVLEFASGVSPGLRNKECDEILYVLGSTGEAASLSVNEKATLATIFIDGRPHKVGPGTGIFLQPEQTLSVENPDAEPIIMITSQCPEPLDGELNTTAPIVSPLELSLSPDRSPIVRLADRPAVPTADRWYRVLVDDEVGSRQVTQFVGSIPPGRAPDHFHHYEEVLFIIRGKGRLWPATLKRRLLPARACICPAARFTV
jgi:hypothetical protein